MTITATMQVLVACLAVGVERRRAFVLSEAVPDAAHVPPATSVGLIAANCVRHQGPRAQGIRGDGNACLHAKPVHETAIECRRTALYYICEDLSLPHASGLSGQKLQARNQVHASATTNPCRTGVACTLFARDVANRKRLQADKSWTRCSANGLRFQVGDSAACTAASALSPAATANVATLLAQTIVVYTKDPFAAGSGISRGPVPEDSKAAAAPRCAGHHRHQGPTKLDQASLGMWCWLLTIFSSERTAAPMQLCSMRTPNVLHANTTKSAPCMLRQ
jgi:hypothetical protein